MRFDARGAAQPQFWNFTKLGLGACVASIGRYSGRMHFLFRYIAVAVAVYLTVNLVPGIIVTGGWPTDLLIALVWSVIIMVIKPVLNILSLPITILTLGLFNLIINALLFWAMEWIVPGFYVRGFLPALLGSIVLSIFSWLIEKVF